MRAHNIEKHPQGVPKQVGYKQGMNSGFQLTEVNSICIISEKRSTGQNKEQRNSKSCYGLFKEVCGCRINCRNDAPGIFVLRKRRYMDQKNKDA